MYQDSDLERVIGTWRRSMSSPGFWLRIILTLTLYYWLFWQRNQIVLTNRRITQYRAYLIGGSETSIRLENIAEVNIYTPPLGALLKFADVTIESKGGNNDPEIAFDALERPDQLKQSIFGLQDRIRRQQDW